MKAPDVIAITVVAAILAATCFINHERTLENQSLRDVIREEVKAEMDRRYRNVPHISVEKVYTLHATGEEIILDAE